MRISIACILLVFYGHITSAQPLENSLLWRISGKSLKTPSYLYGTMHLLCPNDLSIKPHVEQALSAAQQVAFELDMDDPKVLGAAMAAMLTGDGSRTEERASLKEALTKDEYALVEGFFRDSLDIDLERYAQFASPSMLAMLAIPKALGCQPASVEQRLMELVKTANKNRKRAVEIVGLETVEKQLSFLSTTKGSEDAAELLKTVKDFSEMRRKIKQLARYYNDENLEGLQMLMTELPGDMNARLITQRNHAWIRTIERLMKRNAMFIAVGAGHLPGNEGVIKLLRKAGYVVEAVRGN